MHTCAVDDAIRGAGVGDCRVEEVVVVMAVALDVARDVQEPAVVALLAVPSARGRSRSEGLDVSGVVSVSDSVAAAVVAVVAVVGSSWW